ncbi:spindle and kinetochore-associated protein 3 [Bombina bombina]|uniref:spindle and kinetochore-associated protein 3 n=1 Tax=Bombina bombina TaxID=8345 RepID=UPI00235A4F0C|nr:spindle and kinetochore-associated protein 3 [Bombina bombina]
MSITGNFFSKLRTLAVSLEKETEQLEQAFSKEDIDYETEAPMRVLHDLRSEIKSLKGDIQSTIDKEIVKRQELNDFIKICRVLQQRSKSDIQQITDTFKNYGYIPLEKKHTDGELTNGDRESENDSQKCESGDVPALPTVDKPATDWDLLRPPQLSDFGLSHYKLPSTWDPLYDKLYTNKEPEEKHVPTFRNKVDINPVTQARTPRCALRLEDDYTQTQHFGISDSSTNLNADYTIALFNKQFKKTETNHEYASKEINNYSLSKDLKNIQATPAHLTHHSLVVDSPLPPIFCTPGLKTRQKQISAELMETFKEKEQGMVKNSDTPPLPAFETTWLKSDGMAKALDIKDPPKPKLTNRLDMDDTAPSLVLNSGRYYQDFENTVKIPSPPKMSDFILGTPQRPEMTLSLTEDLFKYNMKPSSPPKVAEYEKMFWTPTRPEMTTYIPEDITQILSKYCDNKSSYGARDQKQSTFTGIGNGITEYKDKENRLY